MAIRRPPPILTPTPTGSSSSSRPSTPPSSSSRPSGDPPSSPEPAGGRLAEDSDAPTDRVGDNAQKRPEEWKTGDEPMTGAQRSYLKTLSDEAHVPFDETLSKAEASKRIDELQHVTGRGRGAG